MVFFDVPDFFDSMIHPYSQPVLDGFSYRF